MKSLPRVAIQMTICSLVAGFVALTTHIYVSQWTNPILEEMMRNAVGQGIEPQAYPSIIIYAAYITTLMTTGFLVFCYYHVQHLIPGKSKIAKILCVTAIIFGIKGGDLIRQPIMDIILNHVTGFENPILFVVLNHMDKWLANIFLAVCLVYLCPQNSLDRSVIFMRN